MAPSAGIGMGRLVFCPSLSALHLPSRYARSLDDSVRNGRRTFRFLLAKLDQADAADCDMSCTDSVTSDG